MIIANKKEKGKKKYEGVTIQIMGYKSFKNMFIEFQ